MVNIWHSAYSYLRFRTSDRLLNLLSASVKSPGERRACGRDSKINLLDRSLVPSVSVENAVAAMQTNRTTKTEINRFGSELDANHFVTLPARADRANELIRLLIEIVCAGRREK